MPLRPNDFPTMRSHYRSGKAFDEALHLVNEGMREGRIYNVRFVQAKETLGRAVHEGWRHVLGASVYGQILDNKTLEELFWALSVSNVHELTSAKKKLDSTTVTGPVVELMRAYVNECWPIALAMTELKGKTIAGRVPREVPLPVNPNRLEMTCACCFRLQAVIGGNARGHMAHHGYERPGDGTQTRSCLGVQFQPLETSPKGLVFIIGNYRWQRDGILKALAHPETKASLTVREGSRNGRPACVTITRADLRWAQEFRVWVSNLESELRHLQAHLARLEKTLAEWKPAVPVVAVLPLAQPSANAQLIAGAEEVEVEVELDEDEDLQVAGPRR